MSLEADGMDILLTHGRSEVETRNEMKTLVEFIRGSINPVMEIRWVIRAHNRPWEEIQTCLKAMEGYPPNMVRIDQHLELPNVDTKTQVQMVAKIKDLTAKPLKISGNVDLGMIKHFQKTSGDRTPRFDVNPKQAINILNELKRSE
jgi:hypothetical protein